MHDGICHMVHPPPLGAVTPCPRWEQTPPGSRPLGADPPWQQTPPGADTPLGADPPWSRHPSRADSPPRWSLCGWYASYWNAFLLIKFSESVLLLIVYEIWCFNRFGCGSKAPCCSHNIIVAMCFKGRLKASFTRASTFASVCAFPSNC